MSQQEIGGIGFYKWVSVAGTRLRVGFERLDALCYLYRQPNGNSESLLMATPYPGSEWPELAEVACLKTKFRTDGASSAEETAKLKPEALPDSPNIVGPIWRIG